MCNNIQVENNIPINPSGMALLGKVVIGIIIGLVFSVLVFVVFIGLGSSIDQAIKNSTSNISFSPLVWLSFIAIASLISIVGSIVISGIYNVIWNEDYYDMKVMSSSILAVNLLLFIPFLFLYFYVGTILSSMEYLFVVYGFHLFFAIYISFISMDIVKNPNYASVYVIGNSFGFILSLLLFFIIYSLYSKQAGSAEKNILFFPPILAFTVIPFISTLFEKIYYKFYEMGNDFLYIASLSEVMVDEEEVDEVNVDIK